MTDSPEREKQPAAESASSEPGSSAAGSTSGGWPKLTLVFSTPGDFSSLRRILGEICEQDYPLEKLEVMICDKNLPSPLANVTREFSGNLPGLRILHNLSGLSSSGRNLALKSSSAPFVVMLDESQTLPGEKYLKDIVQAFSTDEADCLCRDSGYIIDSPNLFQSAVALAASSFFGYERNNKAPGEGVVTDAACGAMYRREVFGKVGPYDESFDMCDDADLNQRVKQAGLKLWFAPSLSLSRYPEKSVSGLWKSLRRLGAGRYRLARKHKRYPPTQLVPPAGTLALGVFLLLGLLTGFSDLGAFELGFNVYVAIVALTTALISLRQKNPAYLFSLPVIFPVMHLSLGVGFLQSWFQDLRLKRRVNATGATGAAPTGPSGSANQ